MYNPCSAPYIVVEIDLIDTFFIFCPYYQLKKNENLTCSYRFISLEKNVTFRDFAVIAEEFAKQR